MFSVVYTRVFYLGGTVTIASLETRAPDAPVAHRPGLLSRLGVWSATHLGYVLIAWLVVVAVFGAFGVQVEQKLSGAGWQDSGSQSVRARKLVAREFNGLNSTALQVVISDDIGQIASDPAAKEIIDKATAVLKSDRRISTVVPPQAGMSISRDGHVGVIQAAAAVDANEMVRAALPHPAPRPPARSWLVPPGCGLLPVRPPRPQARHTRLASRARHHATQFGCWPCTAPGQTCPSLPSLLPFLRGAAEVTVRAVRRVGIARFNHVRERGSRGAF